MLLICDCKTLLSGETKISMDISRFIPIITGIKPEMTISYFEAPDQKISAWWQKGWLFYALAVLRQDVTGSPASSRQLY